jgi:TetR/AcrR family transcriptional regulator, cholesterol catabolism regulator
LFEEVMTDKTTATKSSQRAPRQDNRREHIMDMAAALFCEAGYHGTSMRNIAKEVGMLPGSMYYHFPSKADLLVAVYEEGIRRIEQRVDQAIRGVDDPTEALRATARAHLEALLDQSPYSRVVIRVWPQDSADAGPQLNVLRDRYEDRIRSVVDKLKLPSASKAHYLRLMLLGALNGVQSWYREDGDGPAEIADQFIDLIIEQTLSSGDK